MRILVLEDDSEAAAYLIKGLKESGHVSDHAADGEEGLEMVGVRDYDVLIVDRMLPGRDGLSVVQSLREKGNDTPVLILSALGKVDDRIAGLRAGGDDYLTIFIFRTSGPGGRPPPPRQSQCSRDQLPDCGSGN